MNSGASDDIAWACARAMYADDKAARELGIEILDMREGYARLTMTVRDDMINGHDMAHGGYIFTLADTAFAYACNSHDQAAVAAGASIDFVGPAHLGDCLTAVAEVQSQRGRSGLYDVRVTDQEQRLIACFRGRSSRIGRPVLPDSEDE